MLYLLHYTTQLDQLDQRAFIRMHIINLRTVITILSFTQGSRLKAQADSITSIYTLAHSLIHSPTHHDQNHQINLRRNLKKSKQLNLQDYLF